MALRLGSGAVTGLRLGSAPVLKLMIGATEVWAAASGSAPTVEGLAFEFGSTNAPSANISALAPAAGDEIVVFVATNKQATGINLTGYTELLDDVAVTSLTRGAVFRKTAAGGETTVAPVLADAGFARWAIVVAVVSGTSGLDVSDMGSITTMANTPAPSVTTTGPNRLILSAWFASTDLGVSALPATALGEGFGGQREWAGASYTTQAAAGASTPLALTASSGTRRAVTLAFAP